MASKEGGAAKSHDEKSEAKLEQQMKDSPYVQAENIEDYKRQGYGTEGHQQVQPGRGAGATEGPTKSGGK